MTFPPPPTTPLPIRTAGAVPGFARRAARASRTSRTSCASRAPAGRHRLPARLSAALAVLGVLGVLDPGVLGIGLTHRQCHRHGAWPSNCSAYRDKTWPKPVN